MYKLENNGKETLKNCKAEDEIYEGPVKADMVSPRLKERCMLQKLLVGSLCGHASHTNAV